MGMLSPERKRSLASKALRYASNRDARVLSYLDSRGISSQVAEMWNLGLVPAGEDWAGRMSIPYMTRNGCVDIKYRDLSGVSDTKYGKEPGLGLHLFNAGVLREAQEVVLTEGELDAIVVQSYCGIPAVGYPGTDAWNDDEYDFWPLCFDGVKKVYVIADGDPVDEKTKKSAGRSAAQKVADLIGWSAKVVDLGDGMDANSFIAKYGHLEFEKRIRA